MGFAASLAGSWSNRQHIAIVHHPGRTNIAGLLFVNLYFHIFIGQRFRADTVLMPALQQALDVACYTARPLTLRQIYYDKR